MAERFLAGQNPTAFSFVERFGHLTEAIRTGQALDFVKPGEMTFAREVGAFLSDAKLKRALDQIIAEEPNAQRRSFRMASHITNELSYRLITQFQNRVTRGNLIDAFQSLTGLLPVGFSVTPYLVAFGQQAPDRALLTHVARRFTGTVPQPLRNEKRAWFTDTLEDVNGVARTIRAMTLAARDAGADLTVVTSRSKLSITDIPIKNFPPVGEFEIPEYELQKLSFPPFLDMLDYIQRERFTELIISTPGPIGLCALGCAKLLGLRTSGIYHTDFPQYARFLSDDAFMETLVWNYMQWFYGQTDLVYVNSEFYRRRWIDRGIAPDKLRIFPRGLDTELFQPRVARTRVLDETRRERAGAALCRPHLEGKGPQSFGRSLCPPCVPGPAPSRSPLSVKALTARNSKSSCRGHFYRHSQRTRTRRGLRFSRPFRLPKHHRYLRQRRGRSDVSGPARGRLGYRRPEGTRQNLADGACLARARCRRLGRWPGSDAGQITYAGRTPASLQTRGQRPPLGQRLRPILGGWVVGFLGGPGSVGNYPSERAPSKVDKRQKLMNRTGHRGNMETLSLRHCRGAAISSRWVGWEALQVPSAAIGSIMVRG